MQSRAEKAETALVEAELSLKHLAESDRQERTRAEKADRELAEARRETEQFKATMCNLADKLARAMVELAEARKLMGEAASALKDYNREHGYIGYDRLTEKLEAASKEEAEN